MNYCRFMGKFPGFPKAWSAVLQNCGHVVSMSIAETTEFLTAVTRDLADALEKDPSKAKKIGAQFIHTHFVGDEALGHSIAAIHTHFTASGDDPEQQQRLAQLLDEFSTGYVGAFRRWLLGEQESLRAAEVTARRAAEAQLRSSEARLRAVFTQAGVGTAIADVSGRFLEANAVFAEMLGYSVEELCAKARVTDFAHPHDADHVWDQYRRLIAGELDSYSVERAYLSRDGRTVWANANVSLVRDKDCKPEYTLVLLEDVSERRALQKKLRHKASHDTMTGLPNRTGSSRP